MHRTSIDKLLQNSRITIRMFSELTYALILLYLPWSFQTERNSRKPTNPVGQCSNLLATYFSPSLAITQHRAVRHSCWYCKLTNILRGAVERQEGRRFRWLVSWLVIRLVGRAESTSTIHTYKCVLYTNSEQFRNVPATACRAHPSFLYGFPSVFPVWLSLLIPLALVIALCLARE